MRASDELERIRQAVEGLTPRSRVINDQASSETDIHRGTRTSFLNKAVMALARRIMRNKEMERRDKAHHSGK